MKVVVAILVLALAALAGGCGGSDETATSPSEEAAVDQTKTATERSEPPSKGSSKFEKSPAEEAQLKKEYADAGRWKVLKKVAGNKEDRLIIPVGPPPVDEIWIRDLRVGNGAKLELHDQYQLEYLGFDYSSGELVENPGREEEHWWTFGAAESNKSREIGLKGMRVGGVREVITPAAWLGDNDAAVFIFKLRKVFKEK